MKTTFRSAYPSYTLGTHQFNGNLLTIDDPSEVERLKQVKGYGSAFWVDETLTLNPAPGSPAPGSPAPGSPAPGSPGTSGGGSGTPTGNAGGTDPSNGGGVAGENSDPGRKAADGGASGDGNGGGGDAGANAEADDKGKKPKKK